MLLVVEVILAPLVSSIPSLLHIISTLLVISFKVDTLHFSINGRPTVAVTVGITLISGAGRPRTNSKHHEVCTSTHTQYNHVVNLQCTVTVALLLTKL